MKKVQRSSFKLNPIAAAIVVAMSAQLPANTALAGSGWGLTNKASAPAVTVPVQTYYANSPSGAVVALDPATGLPTFDPVSNLPIKVDSGKAMRKFVDTLPGFGPGAAAGVYSTPNGKYIPIAVPEKWTDAAGKKTDDYYEIAAVEYTDQMHSDLPKATHLRGYVQLMTPGLSAKGVTAKSFTTLDGRVLSVVDLPHHLGPVINATSGTAVRVKFTNYLPVGGNLFLPVDKSLTGAGLGPDGTTYYTENRAEIHLVGGEAPWISAGSPHQWVAPAGETAAYAAGLGKGVSNKDVPDMAPAGAGSTTLYFPNTQSARFTFYQDRTSGLTRLNNYAGLEAGYTVTDPTEKSLISTGVTGGVLNNALPADQIPLILEDKTFVPSNVSQQDAKWDTTHWGQPGDLWFPHVYETNQDPNAVNGSNSVGRWDYGPWFWPIFAARTALPTGDYGDASYVPESYQDTPVINGTAYPTLTIDPKAYRFRIANVSNDRYFNLGLYKADPSLTVAPQLDRNGNQIYDKNGVPLYFTNTEVKMVPAVADATGTPLKPTYPADPNMATRGYDCLCQYPALPQLLDYSFSGPTRAWPIDNRVGGAPDPTMVGPDFIAIGNDGGFLPNPVDIPSQPVTYEANRRSITVTNVYGYGLLVGPSERTDVVVDFTAYAGKTLILYNDAPTPFPYDDQRDDYFTGEGDLTSSGGTYNTKPGYGPNTRTIMQIKVNATNLSKTGGTLNVAKLTTALPAAYKASQTAPIVPESAYNNAFGTKDPDNYAHVATGSVAQPTLDFTTAPTTGTVNITGVNLISSGGQLLVGTANIVGNAVPGSGTGYLTAPTVNFVFPNGGSCTTAPKATATVFNTPLLSAINVSNGGAGYTVVPNVKIGAPAAGGIQATATATIAGGIVTGITIVNPGSGYVFATPPAITITPGTVTTTKKVNGKTVTTTAPDKGTGAFATATVLNPSYQVTSVTLNTNGAGCTAIPDITFTPTNGGLGASATVVVTQGTGKNATSLTTSLPVHTKAEQELFDAAGRYNATGGVELPWTSGVTQTTVPLNYTDSPTEFIGDSEVQVWKLVDNGFWSNSIHFDMVDVQLINRVGWDGTIKAPANNELGWKDTVRLNALEDMVVAIRAKRPQVPFGLPASVRAQDPSIPVGAAASANPKSSQLPFLADPGVTSVAGASLLTTTVNTDVVVDNNSATSAHGLLGNGQPSGYDNEFTWGTAILSHAEDDFTRPVVYHPTVTKPSTPTGLKYSNGVLSWTDATAAGVAATLGNAANEVGFQVWSAPTAGGDYVMTALPANTISFADLNGISYKVVAFNNAGQSTSTVLNLKAPVAPGISGFTNVKTTSLTVSWPAAASATGYTLQYTGGGKTVTLPITASTSANVTGLSANTSYSFQVSATNTKATSASYGTPSTQWTLTTAPLAPTTANVAATTLTLNWTAVTGATSYIVQSATNAAFTTGVATTTGNITGTSQAVTGLTANTTYYFRVVAVNAGGSSNGAASKAVLTAPDVPTVTAANGTKGGTFTGGLNFTPLGLTYKLNWTGAATGSVTVTKSGPITFAKAGTYSMTLTATNASGSATSAAVNVTVQ